MKAYNLEVGSRLPHSIPNYTKPHTVVHLWYDQAHVKVHTTEGNFKFHLSDEVSFPKADRRPIVFIGQDPKPIDLAVNDILSPPDPKKAGDPRFPSEDWSMYDEEEQSDLLDEHREAALESGQYQIVEKVTFPSIGAHTGYARIFTLYPAGRSRHVWSCWSTDSLSFPRQDAKPVYEPRERKVKRELLSFGPYVSNITKKTVYFAKHPFGKGRWPSSVREYGLVHADGETIRPPKTVEDWDDWTFMGNAGERHPNDRSSL